MQLRPHWLQARRLALQASAVLLVGSIFSSPAIAHSHNAGTATVATSASQVASAPQTVAEGAAHVVAAENFYGNLIKQLGGDTVYLNSILSNPNQDPHSFEASPKVARALANADLVVYNGADYDPWIKPLLSAAPHAGRTEIVAADLIGKKVGDNPHLWYDPATMPAVAKAVTTYLSARDPAHAADYQKRLNDFITSLAPVNAKIASLRERYQGVAVSATEPVFGYMAQAIGLTMLNDRFQLAVMNGAEPSATDVAAFEKGLRNKQIKVLIYNAQVSDQMSRRLLSIAKQTGVPVVPVTETEPAGMSYVQWMSSQLDLLDKALAQAPK